MLRCPLSAPNPRRLHLARQLAGIRHASPIAPLPVGLWAGRGAGSLSLAGTCPHAADGPQTLRSGGRWLLSKCFPPSPAACYVLNRRTAGPVMPHGGTPPTGHGPFGCPQPVWRAEGRLTISLIAQQFAHSGCSSPTRSQARHKNQTACEFCVAIRIIALVRLVACDGHPHVSPFSMRSQSLLVKNRRFFKTRAVSAR